MKILRASFAGCSISSGMQPYYQALNPPYDGWKFIVGVPVWYNSLQLPTQVEIRIHHEMNYENPAGN